MFLCAFIPWLHHNLAHGKISNVVLQEDYFYDKFNLSVRAIRLMMSTADTEVCGKFSRRESMLDRLDFSFSLLVCKEQSHELPKVKYVVYMNIRTIEKEDSAK
jgi:hypothetical protein